MTPFSELGYLDKYARIKMVLDHFVTMLKTVYPVPLTLVRLEWNAEEANLQYFVRYPNDPSWGEWAGQEEPFEISEYLISPIRTYWMGMEAVLEMYDVPSFVLVIEEEAPEVLN